jgi:hypothetical protein
MMSVRYRLPGSSEIITLVAQDTIKEMLIDDKDAITLAQLKAAIADRRGMARNHDA